jgi:hypothetical protein
VLVADALPNTLYAGADKGRFDRGLLDLVVRHRVAAFDAGRLVGLRPLLAEPSVGLG